MRTLLVIGVTALALTSCGGTDESTKPAQPPAKPPPADALLAVWNDPSGSELFWADSRTLEPVDRQSFVLRFFYGAAERSPDGKVLAVGGNEKGIVEIVDLERMTSLGSIDLSPATYVELLQWTAPDRLVASLSGEQPQVAVLDPTTRQVVSVHELEGTVVQRAPAGDGLVFLLAPAGRIGPARLAVFEGDDLRYVDLPQVRAGWEADGEQEDYRARQFIPALAVDPSGSRALVIPAGNRVTEIDLETLATASHDIAQPVSLLERFRNWLEPGAWAKMIDGPDRNAVWLPNGLVAVSGVRYVSDGDDVDVTPAGLALVDPSNWSVQRISDAPGWVAFRGGALLGSAWDESSQAQTLHVFGQDGTPRFGLERQAADLSQVAGDHLYVATEEGARYEIVDLATGETVGRAAPKRATWLVHTE